MIYKQKNCFGGKMSYLWVASYFAYCWDFRLELTSKYKKEYTGEFWRNYQEILEKNIENKKCSNLQIYYCWSEWWKYKQVKLIEMFTDLKNKYTKEELKEIYLKELKEYNL